MKKNAHRCMSTIRTPTWLAAHAGDPVLRKTWGAHPRGDDLAVVKRPHKKGLPYQQTSLTAADGRDIPVPATGNDPLELLIDREDAAEMLWQLGVDAPSVCGVGQAGYIGCADVSALTWMLATANRPASVDGRAAP